MGGVQGHIVLNKYSGTGHNTIDKVVVISYTLSIVLIGAEEQH